MRKQSVYISYSDKDIVIVEKIYLHLSTLLKNGTLQKVWYKNLILAGQDINLTIQKKTAEADIFIPIFSIDYFDSKDCYKELIKVVELYKKDQIKIIPVIARACLWDEYLFLNNVDVLFDNNKPIVSKKWDNVDEPYLKLGQYLKDHIFHSTLPSFNRIITEVNSLSKYIINPNYQLPDKDSITKFKNCLLERLTLLDKETYWDPKGYAHLNVEVQVQKSNSYPKKITTFNKAVLNTNFRSFLVLGDPGSGKSIALRELAKKLLTTSSNKIPIYINLRDWYNKFKWSEENLPSPLELENYAIQSLKDIKFLNYKISYIKFIDDHFRTLHRKGFFIYLFDSFDEIPAVIETPDKSDIINKLSEVISIFSKAGGYRTILSSRIYKKPTSNFESDITLLIRPLSDEKIIESLRKSEFSELVIKKLFNKINLRPLIKNPFTLSLIKDFLKNNSILPVNQIILFENCIRNRLNLKELSVNFKINEGQIIQTTKAIAELIYKSPNIGLTIHLDQINLIIKNHSINKVISILRKRRLARFGKGQFGFVHRKFFEYFVALNLKEKPELIQIEDIAQDIRNRDALVVYCEIAEDKIANSIVNTLWGEIKNLTYKSIPINQLKINNYKNVLNGIIEDFKKQKKLQELSYKTLKNYPEFIQFHDNYINYHYGKDYIVFDEKYRRSLNCLRFLIDAFKSRREVFTHIESDLDYFIEEKFTTSGNLIYKKHLIESIALLDQKSAESQILYIYKILTEFPNTYLLNALIDSIKYLDNINHQVLYKLLKYYSKKYNSVIYSNNYSKISALKYSKQLEPLYQFLYYKLVERRILIFLIFLSFITSTLIFLSLNNIFLNYGKFNYFASNVNLTFSLFFTLLFILFYLIPISNQIFKVKYPFDTSTPLTLKEGISKKLKSLLKNIIKNFKFYPFVATTFTFLLIYLMLYILDISGLTSNNKASNNTNYEVFISFSIITISLVGIYQSYINYSHYIKDSFKLYKFKKELKDNVTRINIATHFNSFHNDTYQFKYVSFLEKLLSSENIIPLGEWPNGYLPNRDDNEASGKLAQLEEKWRGLSR